MGRQAAIALYVLLMVALIVSVDVLILRHQFWWRLLTNIAIVVVFGAVYFRFIKH